MSKLVCTSGMNQGDEFPLAEGVTTIGRGSECHIVLYDKKCSRKHCQVHKKGAYYSVEDLDSRNGVLLNKKPVGSKKSIKEGDKIQIGSTILVLSEKAIGHLLEQTATDVAAELVEKKFDKLMDQASALAMKGRAHQPEEPTVTGLRGLFRGLFHKKP